YISHSASPHCRTPSILNKDPPDKKPKNEKTSVSLKHEFDPTGLVQRCVIIQRDENGFGLTVSGDNPVFVQLVKEDGAAMRAGVQTGDRIIKVNGTLVTHSNHIEVVKLIKSGSYVALTVLGRPPGLPQISLEEEKDGNEEGGEVSTSLSAPNSPALSGGEQSSCLSGSPQHPLSTALCDGVRHMAIKHTLPFKSLASPRNVLIFERKTMHSSPFSESIGKRETPCQSPDVSRRDGLNFCSSPETDDTPEDCSTQCIVGNPPYLLNPQIIGAEDDYFDSQQEQINGLCSCFQSIDLLKSRPAHLAVFLHHVVSQFDPAPLMCFLYADMHKQTSSKESRRFFIECSAVDCVWFVCVSEKRRLELIPEELCKQYTQALQDTLLPDLHKNLEDFRQKRSMGLTLAEDELSKLDSDRGKDQQALEKECSCAEHILTKIEDILEYLVFQSQHFQEKYVLFVYKQKSVKPEKEGEEKVKKPRFPNILGPPRRLSRVDSTSGEQKTAAQVPKLADRFSRHFVTSITAFIRARNCKNGTNQHSTFQQSLNYSSVINLFNGVSLLSAGSRMEVQCSVSSPDIQSEDDQAGEVECQEDPLNWQRLVSRDVLAKLTPQEIKRQEVINELFYTERAHLRRLKVIDCVFYQRLNRDGILPPEDIKHIFINLEEIIQLHVSVTEQMTAIRKRSETSVIGQIGDDLLAWFSGEEEEKIIRAVGTFCSNQPSALELIKTRKKKDQRFNLFMQEAESNRLCRRLQLKDIIPAEIQRMTKYPLLLDNIAKYTDDAEEREKVKKTAECCKKILNHINQAVKEAENKQRLEDYQRRLDLSSLKQSENPLILELKNLDLTKRKMVHEGPLSWKVNKDKTIELYTILLEDIMVLLQKQDERLLLKFHGKNMVSVTDTKNIFSPIIKLNTVLVRPVATDNKSFFVLSMSDNGAQIYELMAQTVSDQRTWQCLITQCADAMKAKPHDNSDTPAAPSDTTSCSDIQAPAASLNPFDSLKSEDEEEELAATDRPGEDEEDEEVDEAELEAFLDGQLADRLLQEGSRQGIAIENEELNAFGLPSKAEDALRTRNCHIFTYFCGFTVLDFGGGSEESSTEDDVGGDVGIDMRKLLSSSSQTGSGGPDLSRQLMTHLRLLQADLQYLKDVEIKYNKLRQMHSDAAATDSDDNNGAFPFESTSH
uniref:Rho guanine nucleotide exchange factor 12-like n=1 Tax=Acanthochromis polyacanthus TaxID=80966 RepID=A0A3Q1H0S3_9TELE